MSKRLKFFLSHLSLSFLIALLAIGLVFFIWYPSPLATAVGVTHIFFNAVGYRRNFRTTFRFIGL